MSVYAGNSPASYVPRGKGKYQPLGTVHLRRKLTEIRAFVKVAEPNKWILRAHLVWNQAHGPIPTNMLIHHKDENKLNDVLDNLELLTRAQHIAKHRSSYRKATWTKEQLLEALAFIAGGESYTATARRYGIPRGTLGGMMTRLKKGAPLWACTE